MFALLPGVLLSCAESGGPVSADAQWNLTCPADGAVGCPGAPAETCLGVGGLRGPRAIVGTHGEPACTGDPIIAFCEAVQDADGTRIVTLEANVDDYFAFELHAEISETGEGPVTECDVTIIENQTAYGGMVTGRCGREDISMAQPCKLTDVSVQGGNFSLGLECDSLINTTTTLAYDVGAVGGGPTTISFANCVGF
jgi:hypothetical protein